MLRLLRPPLFLALAVLSLCPSGHADDRPSVRLKEEATVADEVITVADVATLSDDVPERAGLVVVGNAPLPGYRRSVGRALVKARLLAADVKTAGLAFSGADVCTVARESRRVSGADIAAAARDYLESCLPDGGVDCEVELLLRPAAAFLPAENGPVELRPVLFGGRTLGRIRVDVDLVQDDVRIRRVPVSFDVKLWRDVAVATVHIAAGDALTEKNVAFVRRQVSSQAGLCVTDPDELRGKVAAATLEAGRIVTRRTLREPEQPYVVEYNRRVFLVVRMNNLSAVCVGKSLSRARRGEQARAVNLATGREVVGTAVAEATIQVSLGVENVQ